MHYLPCKEEALRQELTSIWEKTLKELQQRCVGNDIEEFEEQLKESMHNGYDHLVEANVIASAEVSQNFIEKYNKEISNKLSHGMYHQYEHYFDDLKAMMAEYNNIVQDGPKKEEKLSKFLLDKQEEGALHFIKLLNETFKTDKQMNMERV
jgi:predicted patatin/cPLA2 family phospholipase